MSFVYVENTSNSCIEQKIQGLSTDTKPLLTSDNTGSTFYCVDTGDLYVWHTNKWYPV
jgi:hypothetical protein